MIHQKIPINETNPQACLETYFLDYISTYRYDSGAPVILICPGGGFAYLADREMEPMAMAFNAMGYHAGVIRYSCGSHCDVVTSVADAACAVAAVRRRAGDFRIDPEKIYLCGFSAGGYVAAALGTFWRERWLIQEMNVRCREWIGWEPECHLWRPDRLILGYPVISMAAMATQLPYMKDFSMANPAFSEDDYTFYKHDERFIDFKKLECTWLFHNACPEQRLLEKYSPALHVDAGTPETFLWHTMQDNLVYPENSMDFAAALRKAGVGCELHLFAKGFHGLSMANAVSAQRETDVVESCQLWLPMVRNWLEGV